MTGLLEALCSFSPAIWCGKWSVYRVVGKNYRSFSGDSIYLITCLSLSWVIFL